jgi:GntR family transcriptional repressor for pyruvate dehydrogenase complex
MVGRATIGGEPLGRAGEPDDGIVMLSLSEGAATRIAQEIASGTLRPGERLQPERVLAQRLGLSRGALREALRTLESVGLLTAHVGRGRFVADAGSDATSTALQTWMQLQPSGDLMAVRRILEPAALLDMPAAQLAAAGRRAQELLASMRRALARGAYSKVIDSHTRLHLELVQFGSSRLLRTLTTTMIVSSARWQPDILREPGAARQWLELHEAIVDALVEGDIVEAAARVGAHMQTRFAYRPNATGRAPRARRRPADRSDAGADGPEPPPA